MRERGDWRLARAVTLVVAAAMALVSAAPAPLAVYGNKTTLEIAPVLLAADRLQEGGATVRMGGIPNLFDGTGRPGLSEPGIADLATNAETQALRQSVQHPELRIILTVAEGWYRIVARRSAGIADLRDLKGKRIATVPGTSSAYFLHRMLGKAGLSESDVTIVPIVPLSGIADALAQGRVDAVTVWEPEIEKASAAIGADAIQFEDRSAYRELFNLNATAAGLADPAERRRIVAFVREVIAASKAIRADPAVAWPSVEKASGYDRGLIQRSWQHQTYPGTLAADLLDVMDEEETWLAAQDKRAPRSRAELARLIDPTILEEAIAGASARTSR